MYACLRDKNPSFRIVVATCNIEVQSHVPYLCASLQNSFLASTYSLSVKLSHLLTYIDSDTLIQSDSLLLHCSLYKQVSSCMGLSAFGVQRGLLKKIHSDPHQPLAPLDPLHRFYLQLLWLPQKC